MAKITNKQMKEIADNNGYTFFARGEWCCSQCVLAKGQNVKKPRFITNQPEHKTFGKIADAYEWLVKETGYLAF